MCPPDSTQDRPGIVRLCDGTVGIQIEVEEVFTAVDGGGQFAPQVVTVGIWMNRWLVGIDGQIGVAGHQTLVHAVLLVLMIADRALYGGSIPEMVD
jgi:hypothetical protein